MSLELALAIVSLVIATVSAAATVFALRWSKEAIELERAPNLKILRVWRQPDGYTYGELQNLGRGPAWDVLITAMVPERVPYGTEYRSVQRSARASSLLPQTSVVLNLEARMGQVDEPMDVYIPVAQYKLEWTEQKSRRIEGEWRLAVLDFEHKD